MTGHWRTHWAETGTYLKYWPIAFVCAFLPLLFDAQTAWVEGRLLGRALVCLSYALILPPTVWVVCVSIFWAIAAWRGGRAFTVSTTMKVLCSALGMVLGILLTKLFVSATLGGPVVGQILPSLLFGLAVLCVFGIIYDHDAAKREALVLRAEAAEAGYRALEHQMRPHFLFNALNSLAEMIESEHGGAAGVAHTLSELYRQILANSKTKTSTLASELDIALRYLEIETVRFGRRLTSSVDVPDAARDLHVPSLVVQTLVENAVKHGIAGSIEGGHVHIAVEPADGGLHRLSVANTGAPYRPGGAAGTGIANTRARLDLLYGDRHGFEIGTDGEGRTVASFRFTGERLTDRRRVLVVDDEALARQRVVRYVRAAGAFDVEEAESGVAALDRIREFRPHVVFLDVEMPGMSGFEMLAQVESRDFAVIFETAFDEFAVAAFEAEACDYLLKPFTAARLAEALDRALARTEDTERLRALERRLAEREGFLRRIAVRQGARLRVASEDEISCFVSRDHVTCAYFGDGREGVCDLSLARLEARLDPEVFARLHRNGIVRVDAVAAIATDRDGAMWVELDNGMRLPVSRSSRRAARALARG